MSVELLTVGERNFPKNDGSFYPEGLEDATSFVEIENHVAKVMADKAKEQHTKSFTVFVTDKDTVITASAIKAAYMKDYSLTVAYYDEKDRTYKFQLVFQGLIGKQFNGRIAVPKTVDVGSIPAFSCWEVNSSHYHSSLE